MNSVDYVDYVNYVELCKLCLFMLIYVKFSEKHWFYTVFWRIDENRLQNDWFYIVFCNYWFANGCFIMCF